MDRLPAGLTFSMLIAALSIGALTVFGGLGLPGSKSPPALTHTAAVLCLLWSTAALVINHPSRDGPRRRDILAVLQIASILAGLIVVLLMAYAAVVEVLCRTVYIQYAFDWQVLIWRSGLFDLGMVGAAVVLYWRRTHHHELFTVLLWIMVLASLWASVCLPGQQFVGTTQEVVPTAWASVFMLGCAFSVTVLTALGGWMELRRRENAWPDALVDLTTPEPTWPGFRYSAGVLGVVVMCLGCIHVIVPWTVPAALLGGVSLLALTHRQWNENLADAATALITLCVVAACMTGLHWPIWTDAGYASVFNRALLGLALMTGFWHWLGLFWEQQLDHGVPWTTAGCLIRVTRRVGFLTACAAVLLSLNLAFFPCLLWAIDRDVSRPRWIWGLIANGILILSLVFSARRTGKTTLGWLTLMAVILAGVFVLVRVPASTVGQLWVLYWPLAVGIGAGISLVVAALLSRIESAKPFIEPLVVMGVLIAPASALAGISMRDPLRMPPWIPMATFFCLAVLYLFASFSPGPSTFRVVSVMCAAVGIVHIRAVAAWAILDNIFLHLALAGASAALIAMVYRRRWPVARVRSLMAMGLVLTVLGMVVALFTSR